MAPHPMVPVPQAIMRVLFETAAMMMNRGTQTETIYLLPQGGTASIPTDIDLQPPDGTNTKNESRRGLSFKHNVHVIGRTIDPNFRGNILQSDYAMTAIHQLLSQL